MLQSSRNREVDNQTANTPEIEFNWIKNTKIQPTIYNLKQSSSFVPKEKEISYIRQEGGSYFSFITFRKAI